jgi:hypothetical protein
VGYRKETEVLTRRQASFRRARLGTELCLDEPKPTSKEEAMNAYLFSPGAIVATPAALEALEEAKEDLQNLCALCVILALA